MSLSAVILAGGQSRRMGRDKAWLEMDGESLISRAIKTVRAAGATEVFISARADQDFSQFNCPVLLDLKPGCGPLGGIERGLNACRESLLLVLAVDLPRMTPEFLRKLHACSGPRLSQPRRARLRNDSSNNESAVSSAAAPEKGAVLARSAGAVGVVLKRGDVFEPLAAIYPKHCHRLAAEMFAGERYSARDFAVACLRAGAVEMFDVAPAETAYFANWNQPADINPT